MGSLSRARGPADDLTDASSGVDPRQYSSVQGSQMPFVGFQRDRVDERRRDEHEREGRCIYAWRWTRAKKGVRKVPKRLCVGRRRVTLLRIHYSITIAAYTKSTHACLSTLDLDGYGEVELSAGDVGDKVRRRIADRAFSWLACASAACRYSRRATSKMIAAGTRICQPTY
jgi:hypothetical protein